MKLQELISSLIFAMSASTLLLTLFAFFIHRMRTVVGSNKIENRDSRESLYFVRYDPFYISPQVEVKASTLGQRVLGLGPVSSVILVLVITFFIAYQPDDFQTELKLRAARHQRYQELKTQGFLKEFEAGFAYHAPKNAFHESISAIKATSSNGYNPTGWRLRPKTLEGKLIPILLVEENIQAAKDFVEVVEGLQIHGSIALNQKLLTGLQGECQKANGLEWIPFYKNGIDHRSLMEDKLEYTLCNGNRLQSLVWKGSHFKKPIREPLQNSFYSNVLWLGSNVFEHRFVNGNLAFDEHKYLLDEKLLKNPALGDQLAIRDYILAHLELAKREHKPLYLVLTDKGLARPTYIDTLAMLGNLLGLKGESFTLNLSEVFAAESEVHRATVFFDKKIKKYFIENSSSKDLPDFYLVQKEAGGKLRSPASANTTETTSLIRLKAGDRIPIE